MILDRAIPWSIEDAFGDDVCDEGHHGEIGPQLHVEVMYGRVAHPPGWIHRYALTLGELSQRVRLVRAIGRAEDPHDLFPFIENRFQHLLTESHLTDKDDPHTRLLIASLFRPSPPSQLA